MASKGKRRQKDIAARLLLLRERLFDNASDMARSVHLTPQAWYNYETGRRALGADIAAIVVEEHGVDYNWLFGGTLDTLEPKVRKLLISGDPYQPQPVGRVVAKPKRKRKTRSRSRKTRGGDNDGPDSQW